MLLIWTAEPTSISPWDCTYNAMPHLMLAISPAGTILQDLSTSVLRFPLQK